MKKLFNIFAAALIALSFTGCNNPEPELRVNFDLNNVSVGTTTATIEITPDHLDVWYMRDYFATEVMDNTSKSAWEVAKAGIAELKAKGYTYAQLQERGAIVNGKQTWQIDGLTPGTSYTVVTYLVDEDLNVVGNSFGTGFFETYEK